jgi:hypothetical protein
MRSGLLRNPDLQFGYIRTVSPGWLGGSLSVLMKSSEREVTSFVAICLSILSQNLAVVCNPTRLQHPFRKLHLDAQWPIAQSQPTICVYKASITRMVGRLLVSLQPTAHISFNPSIIVEPLTSQSFSEGDQRHESRRVIGLGYIYTRPESRDQILRCPHI